MNDIELGWLVGIIDGEGSIGITRSKQKGRYIYTAQIQMANCDLRIMEKYRDLINSLGMSKKMQCECYTRKQWQPQYYINIQRQRDVKLLLETVIDHLVGKREQAEIVLEFVNKRIAANHRGQKGPYQVTYDGTEEEYCRRLAKYNRKAIPRRFKDSPD